MVPNGDIAREMAAAFVAGPFEVRSLVERGGRVLGRRWRWLQSLAVRLVEAFAGGTRPRRAAVTAFVLCDEGFRRACRPHRLEWAAPWQSPPEMCPAPGLPPLQLPSFTSPGQLADWLRVTLGELEWFADLRGLESKGLPPRLRHYHYRPLAKRFGRVRLIEAPKPRLKVIQRRLLRTILDLAPPHDAVHGFRRGRSVKSFATPHARRRVVLRLDLEDFFPSIALARVQALFRALGYPEPVADLLGGLCANATPAEVWHQFAAEGHGAQGVQFSQWREARWRYERPHLPQGAPTSPALANLCAFRLDRRLSGLARSAGAHYTRYADDLAFSGDREFERTAGRFLLHVYAIVLDEGFHIHYRKTRVMRQGVRQRLAGVVLNAGVNFPRRDYDRLKATLCNCLRHGPQSQNRSGQEDFRAHLHGRIAHVEMLNPKRGAKLRKIFARIEW